MKRRLISSLATGAAIAAVLVAFQYKYRHAALAASAARPLPGGGHQSVASILTDGFVFSTVIVAAVVFTIATVRARRRRARLAGPGRDQNSRYPQPRRGRAGSWR